jgi:F0F1-type ATP synthase assembly protein I
MEPGDIGPKGRSTRPADRQRGKGFGTAAAGIGVQFAVSIVVFVLLGQWLDRRLGTAPVFLLVCVFVGAGGSFYASYRQLMAAQRRGTGSDPRRDPRPDEPAGRGRP